MIANPTEFLRPTPFPPAKITNAHLAQLAIVYVRQSTPQQVAENRESLARQYALADHARALGWAADRVLVIDDDLGVSGRTAEGRPGFQRLLAEITMDHVGLVLGLEMSRLARSCKDWHQLLEVCALFGALLADQDGLYDPSDPNDRLLLGLKGQISELELHTLRTRLDRGRLNKARRGELFLHAPIGYVKTPVGGLALDPDEQARSTVRLVFEKFDEMGSANALLRYLRRNLIRLPVRSLAGPDRGRLEWRPPRLSTVFRMLRNPTYAGAYAFGQRPVDPKRKRRDGRTSSVRVAPPDQWLVLLHDKVPAYITWERHQLNGDRLRRNRFTAATPGQSREGVALLSGLLSCGRCGHRMHTTYGDRLHPRYDCVAHQRRGEPRTCRSLTAAALDAVVAAQVLNVLTPSGIELSLLAAQDIERERERLDSHWRAETERRAYETCLAERSYRAVDPENRLVARTLERGWEQALRQEREAREAHDRFRRDCPRRLSQEEIDGVRSLAADVPALWHAATTPASDRKEIVRALVEKVTVIVDEADENVHIRIDWIGGSSSEHSFRRPVGAYERMADFPRLRDRVTALSHDGRTAARIAEQLNREGFRPPSGRVKRFNRRVAESLIHRLGLSKPRPPATGLRTNEWWARDLAEELGMKLSRLRHWVKRGRVRVRKVGVRGCLAIWADAQERERLRRLGESMGQERTNHHSAESARPQA